MRTRPALALLALLFFSAAQAQLKRVDTLEYAYPMDIDGANVESEAVAGYTLVAIRVTYG